MTSQTSYWNRLIQPGIVALVGAGGKTTVLSKLVEYGRLKGQPIVVTTTTRLYESQVAHYEPIADIYNGKSVHMCPDGMPRRVRVQDNGVTIAIYDHSHQDVYKCARGIW